MTTAELVSLLFGNGRSIATASSAGTCALCASGAWSAWDVRLVADLWMESELGDFQTRRGELLQSPSKFLVCVHSEILDLVCDEKSCNDAPHRERLQ